MSRKLIITLLVALFFYGAAFSQKLTPKPIVFGQWLKSWMLYGPIMLTEPVSPSDPNIHLEGFDTDFLSATGGEGHVISKGGGLSKYPSGSISWKNYHSPDSIINLEKAISQKNPSLAYAYTEIISDEVKVVQLSFGTDDGGAIWLNGIKVWDSPEDRGVVPDNDMVIVALRKGVNTLLMKIENRTKDWGFCARFLPFKNSNSLNILTITTDGVGNASIISKYAASGGLCRY